MTGSDRGSPSRAPIHAVVAGVVVGAVLLGVGWLIYEWEVLRSALQGVAGVLTTPLILEPTLFITGLVLVIAINAWRRRKDDDEWVYLAEDEPRQRDGQEVGRHDAVFREQPAGDSSDWDLELAEGHLDLEAWEEAGRVLYALDPGDRESPRGLAARIRLARGLGREAEARALEKKAGECEI